MCPSEIKSLVLIGHLSFVVPGEPKGKGRPRAVKLPTGKICMYTPKDTAANQHLVRMSASDAINAGQTGADDHQSKLHDGPVLLSIVATFPLPKSRPKWLRDRLAAGTEIPHTTRPDLSNVIKIVEDALNGVAWKDDSRVCSITAIKRYGLRPRLEVSISYCAPPTK